MNYSFIKSLSHKDGKVWGRGWWGTGRGQQFFHEMSQHLHCPQDKHKIIGGQNQFTENLFLNFNLILKKFNFHLIKLKTQKYIDW
jgi:hypothetical protein